jgi:hypothetical protein
LTPSPQKSALVWPRRRTGRLQLSPARDRIEEVEEEADDDSGIQILTLAALDSRFLVGGVGIEVVKNFRQNVHGEDVSEKISGGRGGSRTSSYSMVNKVLLMRSEANMLLMSPGDTCAPHSNDVHHAGMETRKVVNRVAIPEEWN